MTDPPAGGLQGVPLRIGATYWVGPDASVQFGIRPIYFRLSSIVRTGEHSSTPIKMVWLYGYELTERGDAAERREILVFQAGLIEVDEKRVFPPNAPEGRQGVRRGKRKKPAPSTAG